MDKTLAYSFSHQSQFTCISKVEITRSSLENDLDNIICCTHYITSYAFGKKFRIIVLLLTHHLYIDDSKRLK